MLSLPQLIEEDVAVLDTALGELLVRSEAVAALVIDKGGPLIIQKGNHEGIDTTTMAALAAGSFSANQAIAGLVGENDFSTVYQQGQTHSLLVLNIDDQLLLVVIFKAAHSVGAIKYFATGTVAAIAEQIRKARLRSPDDTLDLVSLNLFDTSVLFTSKVERKAV
jgi:predicted regulator of Ras-like GTPase activity (Roadblock/LC7/MglB family)